MNPTAEKLTWAILAVLMLWGASALSEFNRPKGDGVYAGAGVRDSGVNALQ